jgi:2-polyprenyl-6-methoxyphenol hydroxylase-like FAD-dependent oxidoreductase
MFGKRKPEVLVVGAGPVGLLTALLLAKRGVEVQIVDRQWRTGAHSYALALHAESLRLFEEIGLLEPLLRRGYPVHGVGVYDGRQRRADIRLSGPEDRLPGLMVMPQDVLERLLEETLEQHAVLVQWNHAVSHFVPHSFQVDVALDKLVKESLGYAVAHTEWMIARTTEIQVPWVIGTDGHRSQIRRSLEIDFQEIGAAQHFAVFEFRTDQDLQQEVRLVLGERTTNAVWPLPDGYCRWSFELPEFAVPLGPREKDRTAVQIGAAQFPTLTEEHLRLLLQERAPWFQGSIEDIRWRMVVRFERRLASCFGEERVWLAGDAGHMTGPVGMQSMNVGFREARDLVGLLVPIMRGAGQPEQMQAYTQQRSAEWRSLLGVDGGLRAGPKTDPWIQQQVDRLLACLPATGQDLAAIAQQLGLQFG